MGAMALVQIFSPRLEGKSCLLISAICASYFIGRGIMMIPKVVDSDWLSPEFTVLLSCLTINCFDIYNGGTAGIFGMIIAVISYNLGRGLANYYRSKVSTVFNR